MSIGDFTFKESTASKIPSALKYAVQSGTTASINAGEPVEKLAGAAYAKLAVNNFPTATERVVGIATSKSTETASADGTVDVVPATNGLIILGNPDVASTWNTQAKYNALIGSRVLIKLSAGVFTVLASDSAGNGCIVEYLDIVKYPGKVAFSFSPLCDYRNV
jgi:hypothetical protein